MFVEEFRILTQRGDIIGDLSRIKAMGLFDLFLKDRPKVTEKQQQNVQSFKMFNGYEPKFTSFGGDIYESELVRAAINARAIHVGKLRFEIRGSAKPALQSKLAKGPNQFQTWSQFLYRTSTILDMHNTAVIVPVYDELMNPVGYYTVLPNRCEIVEIDGVPYLRYQFKNGQMAANYLKECAILTKFQYSSDFFGETNAALDPTMKMIHLDNQGVEEAVKNGATFRFMARMNNFQKPEDIKKERSRFNELNLKAEDGGGLLLFPNTYTDIRQLDQKAYTVPEAELKEIRTNVYNYFAVNEDVLQSKAFGDSWAAFYESVIEPFAIQASETLSQAMFTDRERAQGSGIMFTANRLQYLTTAEKLNVSSQMADRGIMNRDEIREIWNLAPIPNGEGQAYTIRGEYKLVTDEQEEENANQE